jgi:hypothetical protein
MVVALIAMGASVAGLLAVMLFALVFSRRRFMQRLRAYPMSSGRPASAPIPPIVYAAPDHAKLRELREEVPLKEIAGAGSDAARAIALMRWVHSLAKHSPNPPRPKQLDAVHLVRLCREKRQRLNCWLFATILNDVYLALGFASRIIHLNPFAEAPRESHIVTCVYLRDVGCWVLMDPDMRGYIVDEQGAPIGVREVRARLSSGLPLYMNDDLDMAGTKWLPRRSQKALYCWYLSKNCFRYDCPTRSEPGYESIPNGRVYVQAIPDGYHEEWLAAPRTTPKGNTIIDTTDEGAFWASP